jgi:hypothetical protein
MRFINSGLILLNVIIIYYLIIFYHYFKGLNYDSDSDLTSIVLLELG